MELFTENPESKKMLPLKLVDDISDSAGCEALKIVFLSAGTGEININGVVSSLNTPAVICLNENESFITPVPGTFDTKLLYFSPSVINSAFNIRNIYGDIGDLPETARLDHYYFKPFIRNEEDNECIMRLDSLTAGKLAAVFEALKAQISDYSNSYWPCRSRSHLIELLFVVQQCYSEKTAEGNATRIVDRAGVSDVIHFININYDKKISIDELSRKFNTNRNSISRDFRKTTGQSIFTYLVKIRLEAACGLLRNTSLPVTEIAERVGFSDLSYWGRAFRRQMGCTPSEYRKNL